MSSTGLTILATNLWHDWPRMRRLAARLEAVAQLIESHDVDLVLLQEAARTRSVAADRWLAERLDMQAAYARANGSTRAIGFEEGLAILSRHPMADARARPLSRGRHLLTGRIALAARVRSPAGDVLAVCVHLSLVNRRNAMQLAQLRTWVAEQAAGIVTIVGGDFNATDERTQIRHARRDWMDAFHHLHPSRQSPTHVRRRPLGHPAERTIDYVFIQQPADRHWRVVHAAHVDGPAGRHSDHRAVLARVVPG